MPAWDLDFPKSTNITWPTCIIRTACEDLPKPNNASALEKLTEEDYVEVGDYVEYACIKRAEFYETPTVSNFLVKDFLEIVNKQLIFHRRVQQ